MPEYETCHPSRLCEILRERLRSPVACPQESVQHLAYGLVHATEAYRGAMYAVKHMLEYAKELQGDALQDYVKRALKDALRRDGQHLAALREEATLFLDVVGTAEAPVQVGENPPPVV